MADTVQQIKDRLSIVDVVSQYLKLERSGGSLRARCPFHAERTPSFFVSPERGTYHCFGCNAGGDIFSFVEQIEGLDFKGALKVLAEKAGVPLVYERPEKRDSRDRLFELLETAAIFYASRLNDSSREYLAKRGITEGTLKSFRVGLAEEAWSAASDYLREKGFSEKEIIETGIAKKGERGMLDKFRNRIMFPIADSAGRIVGFSGRIFPGTTSPKDLATGQVERTDGGFEPPKYMNSPETPLFHKSQILYGFDRAKQAIRKHNCAVLVEGQLDLLASHQAGWGNTVAVSGTAFTPEHAALIRRMTDNLVIALDADEAGIKAAGRAARAAIAGGLNVKVAQLPTGLDPADLILKEGAEAWRASIREAKDIITFLLDVLKEHTPKQDAFRRNVEAIVLPFLVDVQSPIAREQYIREVAGRLGVSEQAVADAVSKLPRSLAPGEISGAKANIPPGDPIRSADRARQAFSLLLWQETLPKPELDLKSYIQEFEKSIGADAFRMLRALPKDEQEAMRFSAEEMYGKSTGLKREAAALIDAIVIDRLGSELREATSALKRAEVEGNEAKIEEIMGKCKLLTTQIAHFHR
ncbi:DNA primase [Candidatus Kaiserbacteria bacterium RIFCSPHIGHO2_12_FULL_53_13]|uniref:DNA primase n=1 Tax=Candidatus Kaiserbacteria bacterium RIFCSPHIGHO2_12_FULL_53_13 TaxID=1798502 RepID=A0A1F6E744_9BACT|nr:MAG: DNA primase [Candidatus Kaiserbacteria bacterium RIFCSPHIGHO2_12_FULL_53_13]OGG74247.1 MAG: DNA primase [Candidatus Kaiserbacteria bacterium RIFCSPLOWO2_01_FULL_52_36]